MSDTQLVSAYVVCGSKGFQVFPGQPPQGVQYCYQFTGDDTDFVHQQVSAWITRQKPVTRNTDESSGA